jgi:hypothetical protein
MKVSTELVWLHLTENSEENIRNKSIRRKMSEVAKISMINAVLVLENSYAKFQTM